MPETITSNDITTFVAKTTMKSSEHNTHMDILRGTRIPFSSSTSTSDDQVSDIGNTSHRWLRVYGSSIEPVDSTSGTLTLTNKMSNILCDLTTTVTHTLPTAVGITGKTYVFKKIIDNTVVWTVDGNGAETIDGTLTLSIIGFNETKKLISDGANWQVASTYFHGIHRIIAHTGNGHGSTNTKIRRMTTAQETSGNAITRATTAANGDSYTINVSGMYYVGYADRVEAAALNFGLSLDNASLTTSIVSILVADRLAQAQAATGLFQQTQLTRHFNSGSVIRPHNDGTADNTSNRVKFHIEKVG